MILPELLDEILDHLHTIDKNALLKMGLVCRRALWRSRPLLFSKVEFIKDDHDFDKFLGLLEHSLTSLGPAVRTLHIEMLFKSNHLHMKYFYDRSLLQVASNLPNVHTLSWKSIEWRSIPPHILRIFFQLPINRLLLDKIELDYSAYLDNFLSRLPPSATSISIANIVHESQPYDLAFSSRSFHIEEIDCSGLCFLRNLFNPLAITGSITCDYFILCFRSTYERKIYLPLARSFIEHVGSSFQRLRVSFANASEDVNDVSTMDFSKCYNVRDLQIGSLILDQHQSGERITSSQMVFWNVLALLPVASLKNLRISFIPIGDVESHELSELRDFPWRNFVTRLQAMFPDLQKVHIQISVRSYFTQYADVLRNSGLGQLEDDGIVCVEGSIDENSSRLPTRQEF